MNVIARSESLRSQLLQSHLSRLSTAEWVTAIVAVRDASLNGVVLTSPILCRALSITLAARRFGAAKRLFDSAPLHSNAMRVVMATGAATQQQWQVAFAFLAQAVDRVNDTTSSTDQVLTAALRAVSESPTAPWSLAIAVFQHLRNPSRRVTVHDSHIELSAATHLPPAELNPSSAGQLISALCSKNRWAEGLEVLKRCEFQRVCVPATDREQLLLCLAKAEKHAETVQTFRGMVGRNFTIGERSCYATLRASEELAETDHTVWADACGIVAALQGQTTRTHVQRQLFDSPFRTCCATLNWQQATKLLELQRQYGFTPTASHFDALACARALATATTFDEASAMLQFATRSTRVCNTLMAVAIRNREFSNVAAVQRRMAREQIPSDFRTHELRLTAAYSLQRWHDAVREFLTLKLKWEQELLKRQHLWKPIMLEICDAIPQSPLSTAIRDWFQSCGKSVLT